MAASAVMDIEDISAGDGNLDVPRYNLSRRNVKLKPTAKSNKQETERESILTLSDLHQSNIPGVGSIYVKTWGCSHNHSDGEYMAGQLAAYGYHITGMLQSPTWVRYMGRRLSERGGASEGCIRYNRNTEEKEDLPPPPRRKFGRNRTSLPDYVLSPKLTNSLKDDEEL